MATKTSKRAGETSTTVSVGIRIDPKIKFALDLMGRLQKRSLTAVIEWAISQAIAQQKIDGSQSSLGDVIDGIWSTDESMRFVKLCFDMPQALTYDELRIWETVKVSPIFWIADEAGCYDTTRDSISLDAVSMGWSSLLAHVERHKMVSTVVPMRDLDYVPFK
jgi:predicted transcriptional regulator